MYYIHIFIWLNSSIFFIDLSYSIAFLIVSLQFLFVTIYFLLFFIYYFCFNKKDRQGIYYLNYIRNISLVFINILIRINFTSVNFKRVGSSLPQCCSSEEILIVNFLKNINVHNFLFYFYIYNITETKIEPFENCVLFANIVKRI